MLLPDEVSEVLSNLEEGVLLVGPLAVLGIQRDGGGAVRVVQFIVIAGVVVSPSLLFPPEKSKLPTFQCTGCPTGRGRVGWRSGKPRTSRDRDARLALIGIDLIQFESV